MEIIHVVLGKANPNRMNGINKVANSLSSSLSELNCSVTLWGITSNPIHDYPSRNYKTRLFKSWKNKFTLSNEIKEAIKSQTKNSVFHIHGGFVPEFYSITKALSKSNLPFIYTPHGAYNTVAINRSWLKKSIYFNLFEKSIIRKAAFIHLIGKSEMSSLTYSEASHKKILIPNGQELIITNHSDEKDRKKIKFVFCGRLLMLEKGLDILLEGFCIYLSKSESDANLLIIGDGPDRRQLEIIAKRLGILNSVVFYGGKFGEEKNKLIQECHANVLFSRNEGMPTAVLEATALGVPSIVSEESNMGDYLRKYDAGIVLMENNPDLVSYAFLEAEKMIHNNVWNLKIEGGRKMLRESFDWRNIAIQFLDYYKKTNASNKG